MATEILIKESETTAAEGVSEETPTNALAEAAIPLSEAAVEIARIDGETQIALAEIQAETSISEHEAVTRFSAQEEIKTCQQSIENLQSQTAEMQEALSSILSRLTPADPRHQSLSESEGAGRPELEASLPADPEKEKERPNKRRWI